MEVNDLELVGVGGTNKIMAGEMSRLAARASLASKLGKPKKHGLGAVAYPFDAELAALAVRYHRTCMRVLWVLYGSTAQRLEPLYADLREQVERDARGVLRDGNGITVNARRTGDFAAGDRQVVGTVKNAIIDGAAARGLTLHVDADEPDLHVDVRLHEGLMTVALDLAGRPMNQRGYRTSGGLAPIKENLAAALVMLARHQAKSEALIDPMAGTGTIAIEAALMGAGRPVWISPRRPASESLEALRPCFAQEAAALFEDTRPFVLANELKAEAVALCEEHIARAGVDDAVQCTRGDFRALGYEAVQKSCRDRGVDPDHGLILSNPPYGERLDDTALLELYEDLGNWCRQFHGWRAAFLVANPAFELSFGGRPRIKKPLNNGSLKSFFVMYDL